MSNFQRLVKYVIWVKIGPIHLQGIKIYPCQLDIIGAVSSEEKKLGQNSKIEIDNSNNNHTTTGSLSSSLHDAEELLLRQYNYLCGSAYEILSTYCHFRYDNFFVCLFVCSRVGTLLCLTNRNRK